MRVLVVILALAQPSAAAADQSPLTLRQAIGEALRASPALREPGDGRTVAGIRQRQAAAGFGLKLTPTFQTGHRSRRVERPIDGRVALETTPDRNRVTGQRDQLRVRDGGGSHPRFRIHGRDFATAAARLDVGRVGRSGSGQTTRGLRGPAVRRREPGSRDFGGRRLLQRGAGATPRGHGRPCARPGTAAPHLVRSAIEGGTRHRTGCAAGGFADLSVRGGDGLTAGNARNRHGYVEDADGAPCRQ